MNPRQCQELTLEGRCIWKEGHTTKSGKKEAPPSCQKAFLAKYGVPMVDGICFCTKEKCPTGKFEVIK